MQHMLPLGSSFITNGHEHYETKAYSILSGCRLRINKLIPDPASLPESYREFQPSEFGYNFGLELETIAEVEEERKQREKDQEEDEKREKERKLKAQADAGKALEEKKSIKEITSPKQTNPDTLVDLNFDEQEYHTISIPVAKSPRISEQEPIFLLSPKNRELVLKLTEMGIKTDAIQTGLELVGADDEEKLVNFITDYIKLEEQTVVSARPLIKQALLLHENKFQDALQFLNEINVLSKNGNSNEQILEVLSMFDNNIKQASKFLEGYHVLKQLGFDDMKIRESLVMTNNDSEKAVQYLLSL